MYFSTTFTPAAADSPQVAPALAVSRMVDLQFARVQACGKAGKPRPVFRASNGAQCRSPSAARRLVAASHADHEASATAVDAEDRRDIFLQEEPLDNSLVGRLRTAAISCLVTAVAIFAPREPALAAEVRHVL